MSGGLFTLQKPQAAPGLSINTNSANTFGSSTTSQPQQAGGLFGSTQQNKPSISLFGPSTTTSQPQQSKNLFGTSTQNQGAGLFGSQSTNNQPQQGAGLFGGQSNQQQGGGLFGSQTNQQQQGGGLFGSNNGQATQPRPNTSLFGSLGQSQIQNQQQQQGGSLFGGLGNQLGNQNRTSAFGNTSSQNQTQQRPSLFTQSSTSMGQTQPAPPQRSLFSNTIGFSQQQQSVPGVRIHLDQLRPTTRFNDLHEDVQKEIETIDKFILQQMSYKDQNQSVMPKIESTSLYVPNDVGFVSQKMDAVNQALENDAQSIEYAKKLVNKDTANARLSFRVVDNLKLPQQYHHSSLWNVPSISQPAGPRLPGEQGEEGQSEDLVSYFSTQAYAMSQTLESYKNNVADIEAHLASLEQGTMQQMQQVMFTRGKDGGVRTAEDQVRELAGVLREFENGILGVASKVGGAREKVQELVLGDARPGSSRSRRLGGY